MAVLPGAQDGRQAFGRPMRQAWYLLDLAQSWADARTPGASMLAFG